ncbi:DUF2285 domain-containing protein [Burkholderia gladioli]|uniref:DUF2285 domain-containing protein n=1 Tax=Burkholderia gladioli TaxID=28095 RepID=UPI00164014E3|nr:DUF2285 domain-containing protein [Burkholderia gladioli]MDN7754719.1 DUF2285 domain-containing protein [Burkholderia gladioli]
MADRSTEAWYPTAAYLYVLHLDGSALAWEYLRRHPDYRLDWLRSRQPPGAAHAWGLRLLEDPALDARDAHPDWFPDPVGMLQLYPDADPPPAADTFAFWRIPGHKYLVYDGKRLVLTAAWPGCRVRFALALGLADGMAYLYAIRAGAASAKSYRAITTELDMLATADATMPAGVARTRPKPAALLELHTLQALDAALAGASLRETAEGLFGAEAVAAGWYADGGLRSRVRRLVRRGQSLMRGGYRRLVQLD